MRRYKSTQPFYIMACSPTSPTICLEVFHGSYAQAINRLNKRSELLFVSDFYVVLCQGRASDGYPIEICRRGYMYRRAIEKSSEC